jgi:hypothetical protein
MQPAPTCSGPARVSPKQASAKKTALGVVPGLHAFNADHDAEPTGVAPACDIMVLYLQLTHPERLRRSL